MITPMQRLNEPWGQCELIESLPPMGAAQEVIYIPWAERQPWGLYTTDRLAVPASIEHDAQADLNGHLGVTFRVTQPLAVQASAAAQATEQLEGEHVYAGRFHLHFGHFLVETLSRFWWLGDGELGGRKILIHGPDHLDGYFDLPWLRTLMEAMQLSRQDFSWSNHPVRYRQVATPMPAFAPQSHAHRAFVTLCRQIGERMTAGLDRRVVDRPAYMSKARLTGGVSRIAQETVIEDVLARKGVEIIYPETLPLAEQVRIFQTRRVILGTTGSAFHLSLFANPGPRLIGLNPIPAVNSNFLLIDALNGAQNVYLHQPGTSVSHDGGPFLSTFTLPDPLGAAKAMLAEI
jgi:capsular polysaccharide biosynthesis protein